MRASEPTAGYRLVVFVTCPACRTTNALDGVQQAGSRVLCAKCDRLFALPVGDELIPYEGLRKARLRCPGCGADNVVANPDLGAAVYCRPCQRVWRIQSRGWADREESELALVIAGEDDGLEPTPVFDLSTPRDEVVTLFDAVCDALSDDAPRLVLADYLLELGDPLGEFIVLQLSAGEDGPVGSAKEREAALLREHGSRWVPPGVDPTTARFHRGLLQSCQWASETDSRHFSWRTVEALHFDHPSPGMALPQTPFGISPRPAIHTLTGVATWHLSFYLSHCSLPQLTTLELFSITRTQEKDLKMLARHPSLQVLSLLPLPMDRPDLELDLSALERICTALGSTLTRLRVAAPTVRDAELGEVLRRHAPRLTVELIETNPRIVTAESR